MMPEQNEFLDGDDYTWPKPVNTAKVDCRPGPEKQAAELAELRQAVLKLSDQVRHLEEMHGMVSDA